MITIFLIALALSLDSFAVSTSVSLRHGKHKIQKYLLLALVFALFQGLMPLLGFWLGQGLKTFISNIDHWIAFVLLAGVGIEFIINSFPEEEKEIKKINLQTIVVLGLATSIDALVVGITFAFMDINLWLTIGIIGLVTFLVSSFGCFCGAKFCYLKSQKIEIFGGFILIMIGLKILLTHLFF